MQRILIIEDDTTIRNGIQLYLQKKEFAVDCADTIAALQIPCLQKWSII